MHKLCLDHNIIFYLSDKHEKTTTVDCFKKYYRKWSKCSHVHDCLKDLIFVRHREALVWSKE